MGLLIKIINDGTGSKTIANYNYEISTNDKIISSGRVEHFYRVQGAIQLAKLAVLDAELSQFKTLIELCDTFKEKK